MKEKGITKTALSERLNIKNQNFNAMLKIPLTKHYLKSPPPSTSPCGSYLRPRKKCNLPQTPILSNARNAEMSSRLA